MFVVAPAVVSAEPVEQRWIEAYVEGTASSGGTTQNQLQLAIGARLGPTDEGLRGVNLRLGATEHFGQKELVSIGFGLEAEGNYRYENLRFGVRAAAGYGVSEGAPLFGSFASLGAVVRGYDLVALHVDGFRARPDPRFAPRYGLLVGVGVGGNPPWYGWVATGLVVLFGVVGFGAGTASG